MKKLSCFTVLKNEVEFLGFHIMSLLPYVDEFVFADGNSDDGTLELLKYIREKYDKENKIKVFENKDCANLQEDYVKLFNWTLKQCTGDYVWFCHPDQICLNPEIIRESINDELRYTVKMISIAGDDRELLIEKGRGGKWATIYKNDYGLHFAGYYGAPEEDFYFRDITGNEHIFYTGYRYLPYKIIDTDIQMAHYCDTKPYARRLGRMLNVLRNMQPNLKEREYTTMATHHPRVTLRSGVYHGVEFKFVPNTVKPEIFDKYKEFERFNKRYQE